MELRGRCGVKPLALLKNINQQQRDLFPALYNTQLSLSHGEQGAERTDGFHAESCMEAITASAGSFSSGAMGFLLAIHDTQGVSGNNGRPEQLESEREQRFGYVPYVRHAWNWRERRMKTVEGVFTWGGRGGGEESAHSLLMTISSRQQCCPEKLLHLTESLCLSKDASCSWVKTLFSKLPTAYCMHYILRILHTRGMISLLSVHAAVHRQVTQNAFLTFLVFINKGLAGFWLWHCNALHCGKQ